MLSTITTTTTAKTWLNCSHTILIKSRQVQFRGVYQKYSECLVETLKAELSYQRKQYGFHRMLTFDFPDVSQVSISNYIQDYMYRCYKFILVGGALSAGMSAFNSSQGGKLSSGITGTFYSGISGTL